METKAKMEKRAFFKESVGAGQGEAKTLDEMTDEEIDAEIAKWIEYEEFESIYAWDCI